MLLRLKRMKYQYSKVSQLQLRIMWRLKKAANLTRFWLFFWNSMAHFLPSSSKRGGRVGAAVLAAAAGGDPALGFAAETYFLF
jgi:hypothetical protein